MKADRKQNDMKLNHKQNGVLQANLTVLTSSKLKK